MSNSRTFKTTLGHRYTMRVCEDEVQERQLFHAVLVLLPTLAVILFAAAAGVI